MIPDKEKVIKEAEEVLESISPDDKHRLHMGITMKLGWVYDVLSLLKNQGAHILTLDQLEDALDTVVWLETPMSENLSDGYSLITAYSRKCGYMFFISPFGDDPSQDRMKYSEYGRSWRCWDRRPLEEQRKAVKWDA